MCGEVRRDLAGAQSPAGAPFGKKGGKLALCRQSARKTLSPGFVRNYAERARRIAQAANRLGKRGREAAVCGAERLSKMRGLEAQRRLRLVQREARVRAQSAQEGADALWNERVRRGSAVLDVQKLGYLAADTAKKLVAGEDGARGVKRRFSMGVECVPSADVRARKVPQTFCRFAQKFRLAAGDVWDAPRRSEKDCHALDCSDFANASLTCSPR